MEEFNPLLPSARTRFRPMSATLEDPEKQKMKSASMMFDRNAGPSFGVVDDGIGLPRNRKNRTMSVDAGMERLVKSYYEESLSRAKSEANQELEKLIDKMDALLKKQKEGEPIYKMLSDLKGTALSLVQASPHELMGGRCKGIVSVVLEVYAAYSKTGKSVIIRGLITKLLWSLTKCSRLVEYVVSIGFLFITFVAQTDLLSCQDSDSEDFLTWAVAKFQRNSLGMQEKQQEVIQI